MSALRATFVMETHLGHRTFRDNLRRGVDAHEDVDATWIDVGYEPTAGPWERLPPVGPRLRGALRGRREVRRGCRGLSDDVRFFNTQVPAVIGGRAVRTRPYVLCTDVTPLQYDRMAGGYAHTPDAGLAARIKRGVNRQVFQAAEVTVAWSRWVRESLIADYGVKPDRVEIIPPGVDTARWRPGPRRPDGPMRILFVGGDLERKGGLTLLRAFASLPKGTATLVLATRTQHPQSEMVTVRRDLTPNSPELIELYRASHVFVMPSEAETFGIAAVEAAATGLPVIASDVGGLRDIVEHGKTGMLIEPGDVDGLRAQLLVLAEDAGLRRSLGEAGRRHAEQRFDATINAGRVVEALRRAASHHGGPICGSTAIRRQ